MILLLYLKIYIYMWRKKTGRIQTKMLTMLIPDRVIGGFIFLLKTSGKLNWILSANFKEIKETEDEKYRNWTNII